MPGSQIQTRTRTRQTRGPNPCGFENPCQSLFFGAQHPSASGGAFNYASPRLRKDVKTKTKEFATAFLKLIRNAAEVKRTDTAELQQVIDKQQVEKERLQRELEDLCKQAAADMLELRRFRQQYEPALNGENDMEFAPEEPPEGDHSGSLAT